MRTLIALAVFALAPHAHAGALYTEVSQQGESRDAFIQRIAPKALEYTIKTRTEVCGVIAQNQQGQFAVNINSSGINNRCNMLRSDVPAGFTFSGYTFHTHPEMAAVEFLPDDYAVPGYLATYKGIGFQEGPGTEKIIGKISNRVREKLDKLMLTR